MCFYRYNSIPLTRGIAMFNALQLDIVINYISHIITEIANRSN